MSFTKRAYLSLGSNLGNRHALLQKAVFRLQNKAGYVAEVSPVYETPALGFEGDEFLNTCVLLETRLLPSELLQVLLEIEKELGRKRSSQPGYQSRTLDIDLIFYEGEVINTPELVVPHPQMHHRNFVLKPLSDIAPQFYHPVLQKDVRNLLQECKDRSHLKKSKLRLFSGRSELFAQVRFMAIEGNIGAGKTTLAKMMARDLKAKIVLERSADNPFLPRFYEEPSKYAFPLEMSFLADRYQQFMEDTSQFHCFKSFMISDYDIFKSLIFAKITLPSEEFKLYRKVFDVMYKNVKKPDLYIYLYQNTERLLEHIKNRGKEYEQHITTAYLRKVNKGYLAFIKGHPYQNSMILNLSDLDFVNNPSDYEQILEALEDRILSSHF